MATSLTGTAENEKLIYRRITSWILKNSSYNKRIYFVLLISCVVLILFILLLFTAWSSVFGYGQTVSAQVEFIYFTDGTAKLTMM